MGRRREYSPRRHHQEPVDHHSPGQPVALELRPELGPSDHRPPPQGRAGRRRRQEPDHRERVPRLPVHLHQRRAVQAADPLHPARCHHGARDQQPG